MNIEEAINKIKEVIYMSDGEKVDYIDINHSDLGGEVSVDIFIKAIETLLTAYEKEKETSHYIQSQLDIANAKLVKEKEIIKNAICFLKYYNKDFSEMSDDEIKQILYSFGKCADIKKEE